MDIMSVLGVQPTKIIKGQTGLYFKFADCLSGNGEPVELFFKPKTVKADYKVESGNLTKISWIEINILWVGPKDFPDFEGQWGAARTGEYYTKEGVRLSGYLVGKVLLPMGEFNDNMPDIYKWLSDKAAFIGHYLETSLLSQVHGKVYMPLSTVFNHMLEQAQADAFAVEDPQIMHYNEFRKYQYDISAAASSKYSQASTLKNSSHSADHDDGEDDGE